MSGARAPQRSVDCADQEHANGSLAPFLAMSAVLTGFDQIDLEGTGMAATYHQLIDSASSRGVLASFMATYAQVVEEAASIADRDCQIRERLMPARYFEGLAIKIIGLWYTGQLGNMLLPQAYVQGLMWRAAETHPPGARQPGYGSWSRPPLPVAG